MTLWLYLLRGFLRAVLAVFAVIAVLVLLFGFVENQRRFGEVPSVAGHDLLTLTLLQAPETLYRVFPLVLMLASLLCFLGLARTSELVVMRAAGISALRLITVPAVASILFGIAFVMAVNPFVAASIRRGQAVEQDFNHTSPSLLSFSKDGVWLRQADEGGGQTVIQAARANAEGTILLEVRLHRFDPEGRIFARIESPSARLITGAWELPGAVAWELQPDQSFAKVSDRQTLRLATTLTGAQIQESFSPPEVISIWALPGFISQMEAAGFSAVRHRLFLQGEIARPVLFTAMVLIGAAFALRPARSGQTGVMMLLSVLCGFLLYFLTDFSATLGAQGQLPLPVAVWTPPIAAILLVTSLLLHLEDG